MHWPSFFIGVATVYGATFLAALPIAALMRTRHYPKIVQTCQPIGRRAARLVPAPLRRFTRPAAGSLRVTR